METPCARGSDAGCGRPMNTFLQDMSYGIRVLLKAPGFALVAVLTLALGIGANTALFSVVNGVLLNPLPYPGAGELAAVYGKSTGLDRAPIAYLNFLDWERGNHSFSSMAMYRFDDYNFTGKGEAERVSGCMISADFFATLGVVPILGRTFLASDDQLGAAPVVILSGGFWTRKFGASPDILGKTIDLNGRAYQIVGVAPSRFAFYGQQRDIYTPLGQLNESAFRDRRIVYSSGMIGRLKPGVTMAQAQADVESVARNLAEAYPQADKGIGVAIVPMKEDIVGKVRPFLLVLLGAVGFLLLIACTNVANLLLARSMARSREFAIRTALGASQTRVIRQLLTESVLLAGMGGALGLLISYWGTRGVLGILPGTLPRADEISLDGHVLGFTVALSMVAAVVFGLAPAWKTSRVNLQQVLQESGRGASGARHRLQGVFVAGEIAMALILLVGAGLMIRSLMALWQVDPGFNPRHAITFNLSIPTSPMTNSDETRARLRAFNDKIMSVPGVQAVSATLGSRPMIHNSTEAFWIEGQPRPANDNDLNQASFSLAEFGLKEAMGLTLERGRFITAEDTEHTPVVIVIDDAFARMYFPNEDPVGKHVNLSTFGVQAEVVGVVGHVKQLGMDTDPKTAIEAQFYFPFVQLPERMMELVATRVAVVVRTQGDPTVAIGAIRQAVGEIDPRAVVYGVQTMNDVISNSFSSRRLSMILLSVFAGVALLLACVGIYGVISYLVGQRTREIGVRMALGAQPRDVSRLVLGQAVRMALVGVGIGTIAALGLTRLMASQLFGVAMYDPLTFAAVALLLMIVAVGACYIPARRAMKVDPIVALRYE